MVSKNTLNHLVTVLCILNRPKYSWELNNALHAGKTRSHEADFQSPGCFIDWIGVGMKGCSKQGSKKLNEM